MILKLRDDYKKGWAEASCLQTFHEHVHQAGPLPLPAQRKAMLEKARHRLFLGRSGGFSRTSVAAHRSPAAPEHACSRS